MTDLIVDGRTITGGGSTYTPQPSGIAQIAAVNAGYQPQNLANSMGAFANTGATVLIEASAPVSTVDKSDGPSTETSAMVPSGGTEAIGSSTESSGYTVMNDPLKYKWEDVEFPITVAEREAQANTDFDPNQKSELDKRVFSMDGMRAHSEDDFGIAYMRVIAYQQGKVYTQKQIFPKVKPDAAYNTYKKFIVSSQSENHVERQQIIKTNKALHAYFFNSSPEVLSIQGFLKTTPGDPWDVAMVLLWEKLIRGTQLALNHAILEIGIAETVYWGYPLVFSHQLQSQSQFVASFAMQMLIIDKLSNTRDIDKDVLDAFYAGQTTATSSEMVTNDIAESAAKTEKDATTKMIVDQNLVSSQAAAVDWAAQQNPLLATPTTASSFDFAPLTRNV